MNEYLVTVEASVPDFFGITSKKFKDSSVYKAVDAREAEKKARDEIQRQLAEYGLDEEEDNFTVSITDIKKIG